MMAAHYFKQRLYLDLRQRLRQVCLGGRRVKAGGSVQGLLQQIDIPNSVDEDTLSCQHPMNDRINLSLIFQRLVPGRSCLGLILPRPADDRFDRLNGNLFLLADLD